MKRFLGGQTVETLHLEEAVAQQQQYIKKVKTLLEEQYTEHPPLALVHSFGCQQNVSDSEKIKGMLAQMGYGFTNQVAEADLILYNTCAVRENAESRVLGNVGALSHFKKLKPEMLLCLCGCMMQQEHVAEKIKHSYPFVDIVFGTHVMHELPEMIYHKLKKGKRIFNLSVENEKIVYEGLPVQRDGTIKAWLPIMYGCDNFCSYCVVPYVRGRERSRASADIIAEAKQIVKEGYKEITLLGQNVNSYGKGLEETIDFSDLLQQINAIPGDFRIRFMTSHPKDCTKKLIDTIAACDKVCNHIHLPVQCGSNRILKLMNRHYTIEDYMQLIDYAKAKIPGVTFTSDIIVGFPGETYEDFRQTLRLIEQVKYDSLYTFIFSKRKGTKAYDMNDPITAKEKSKWFQELLDTQKEIGAKQYEKMVGNTYRVLFDSEGKTGNNYICGRTESNAIVDAIGDKSLIGTFQMVKITKALNWALLGDIIL